MMLLHQSLFAPPMFAARFKDINLALSSPLARTNSARAEWRVHFHIRWTADPRMGSTRPPTMCLDCEAAPG